LQKVSGALGQADSKGRIFYRTKLALFGITKPIDGKPAEHGASGRLDAPATRSRSQHRQMLVAAFS
jgi:hypothetical protein